jgi:hypothetical protein
MFKRVLVRRQEGGDHKEGLEVNERRTTKRLFRETRVV